MDKKQSIKHLTIAALFAALIAVFTAFIFPTSKGISDISSEVDDTETNDYTPYFPEDKIEYNGKTGYMMSKFLSKGNSQLTTLKNKLKEVLQILDTLED